MAQIHNCIHRAVARWHLYGAEDGADQLEMALSLGRLDGVLLPFVESASYIMDILRIICAKNPYDNYYGRVFECCARFEQTLVDYNRTRKILSDREVDVLLLMSEGLKRKEIAESLRLSLATVKTVIQSIFLKLDCNNKTMAIKKGRELNII